MHRDKPLISIVMPICNEVKYLREAIDSILVQTLDDFELIMVDGSCDKRLVPGILPDDSRIIYLYRERQGIADALNYGIENATGKYIARMDADDISIRERLSKQVDFLDENSGIAMVGTWYEVIREDGELIEVKEPPTDSAGIAANLLFENPICHPSVMMHREIIEKGYRYPKTTAEDYALWTSLIPEFRIANLPLCLFKWRRCETSNTSIMTDKVCSSDTESARKYIRQVFKVDNNIDNILLIKNFYKGRLREEVKKDEIQFLLDETKLLCDIFRGTPREFRESVDRELQKRWDLCLSLVGCYTREMRELINIKPFSKYVASTYSLENLRHIFEENRKERKRLRSEKLTVVLYGMGTDGKATLKKLEDLQEYEVSGWTIAGVADKKTGTVKYRDEYIPITTWDELAWMDFDKVIITTSKYRSEIMTDLKKKGVSEDRIMDDAIIYL